LSTKPIRTESGAGGAKRFIYIIDGIEQYQKCPECGGIDFEDEITCAICGYSYWIWQSVPVKSNIQE